MQVALAIVASSLVFVCYLCHSWGVQVQLFNDIWTLGEVTTAYKTQRQYKTLRCSMMQKIYSPTAVFSTVAYLWLNYVEYFASMLSRNTIQMLRKMPRPSSASRCSYLRSDESLALCTKLWLCVWKSTGNARWQCQVWLLMYTSYVFIAYIKIFSLALLCTRVEIQWQEKWEVWGSNQCFAWNVDWGGNLVPHWKTKSHSDKKGTSHLQVLCST